MSALPRAILERDGAVTDASGEVLHFGDAVGELRAASEACVVSDRSALARLRGTGPDLLDLIQRLGTGDVRRLSPGDGRPTVLTSPKGRIVERLFVHHLGDRGILLVGGPGQASSIIEHLKRYTFAERTDLADETVETLQIALSGPHAGRALEAASLASPKPHRVEHESLEGVEVEVVGQDGLSADGFSVVAPVDAASAVWEALARAVRRVGGCPAGSLAVEADRILRGLPASGRELTGDWNPLEAGLWDAVSFDKGCYVGQEVVARLRTYDKVSRSLVGLELPAGTTLPECGTPLTRDGRGIGTLTSVILPPGSDVPRGLGYVKRREIDDAVVDLRLGGTDITVRLIDLPAANGRR